MENGCSFLCQDGLSSAWSFIRGSTVSEIQYDFGLGIFYTPPPPPPPLTCDWIFGTCVQLLVCDSLVCWSIGCWKQRGILCVMFDTVLVIWEHFEIDWPVFYFDCPFGLCDAIQVFSVSFIVFVSVTQLFITIMDTTHLSVCPILLDCTCMQVLLVFLLQVSYL